MKTFLSELRRAVVVTLSLAVVCCGLYPLVVYGLGQILFPDKANGSLIRDATGTIRGSRLLGQQFAADKYFHSRPSSAGNGYDSTSSGGSNLGPTSQKLRDYIAQNVADYRSQNGLATNAPVPADVAKARGMSLGAVRALITLCTDPASWGFLGDPGVNVLELNLALDAAGPSSASKPLAQVP